MRKDFILRSFPKLFSYLLHSNECEQNCEGKDFGNKQVTLDSSSTYTFISCFWKDCTGTKGPAISFQYMPTSSLIVNSCIFIHCISFATAREDGGGAINAYKVQSVSIISSLFHSCSCVSLSSSASQIRYGGGVQLYSVTESLLVDTCTFLFCAAVDDAGGLGIFCCGGIENSFPVQNSRFVSCACPDSSGAYEYCNNTCRVCSSCLYCGCTSEKGGASWICFNRSLSTAEILFSLYHNNGNGEGKDIYFVNTLTNPISYSFTTSADTGRTYPNQLIQQNNHPN